MMEDSKSSSPTSKEDSKSWKPFSGGHEFDLSLIYGAGTPIQNDMQEIIPFLRKWRRNAMTLRFLQVLLGFLATFFSLLTATVLTVQNNNETYNFYAKIFAFIAAVSIGLITAFDLGTKSNNMTDAWRHLTATAIRYNKDLCSKKDVINAYVKGERTIGNVTFNQQEKQLNSELNENKSDADEFAKLDKLVKLKDQGAVTTEEFEKLKESVIKNVVDRLT
jgi:hypothetical protein